MFAARGSAGVCNVPAVIATGIIKVKPSTYNSIIGRGPADDKTTTRNARARTVTVAGVRVAATGVARVEAAAVAPAASARCAWYIARSYSTV